MNRRMTWLSGVLLMVSRFSFAEVVEQGLTVRGRAEDWVVPTCAYVTVYAEERSPMADVAYDRVEKLSEKITSGVKKKCAGVTDVMTRTESVKIMTEFFKAGSTDAVEYFIRQRIRFVCEPKMALAASVVYTAGELNAVLHGAPSAAPNGSDKYTTISPSTDTDSSCTVYFGVKADDDLTRRMYEKALANAAERAKIHAELAGKTLGKILSIHCDEFINGEVLASWAVQNGFPVGIIGRASDKIYASYDVIVTYEFAE